MQTQLCRPYIYITLAGIVALNVGLTLILPVSIAYGTFLPELAYITAGALVLWAIGRRFPDPAQRPLAARVMGYFFEAMLLISLMFISLRVMDYLSKAFAPAYSDGWLTQADALFGLDWLAYFQFIHDNPALHPYLSGAYGKLELVTVLTLILLVAMKRLDRARLLLEGFILCAIISLAFGALFPAKAAVATLISDYSAYPNYAFTPGIYHIATLDALRDASSVFELENGPLVGLVTFPSLHTANGILLILACWRTPLFWPSLAYGALMIPATPIWGGHYIIDLIAGTIMAYGVIWALARHSSFANVWDKTPLFRASARPQTPIAPLHA